MSHDLDRCIPKRLILLGSRASVDVFSLSALLSLQREASCLLNCQAKRDKVLPAISTSNIQSGECVYVCVCVCACVCVRLMWMHENQNCCWVFTHDKQSKCSTDLQMELYFENLKYGTVTKIAQHLSMCKSRNHCHFSDHCLSVSVCYSHVIRTVHLVYFSFGTFVAGDQRTCSGEFGQFSTCDTVNTKKCWRNSEYWSLTFTSQFDYLK